jgi:hypothetical protein
VNYDLNADTGAIITIPFKVVQPTTTGGVPNGTAFKFEFSDGIILQVEFQMVQHLSLNLVMV